MLIRGVNHGLNELKELSCVVIHLEGKATDIDQVIYLLR